MKASVAAVSPERIGILRFHEGHEARTMWPSSPDEMLRMKASGTAVSSERVIILNNLSPHLGEQRSHWSIRERHQRA
jgi:hypothetical protein